jgi:hypothetical protein
VAFYRRLQHQNNPTYLGSKPSCNTSHVAHPVPVYPDPLTNEETPQLRDLERSDMLVPSRDFDPIPELEGQIHDFVLRDLNGAYQIPVRVT